MLRMTARSPSSRGLFVAAAASVACHVLGTWLLTGEGWSGRGDASRTNVGAGPVSSVANALELRFRLATPTEPPRQSSSVEASDPRVQSASAVTFEPSGLEADPPAAGGGAMFASTYLPAEELDRGPAPEPGWILDENVLEDVGRAHMRLRLWVSDKGRIDRVVVLHAEPPGDWVDHAIQPLASTHMRPAERDGRSVASTTVVELTANLETMR